MTRFAEPFPPRPARDGNAPASFSVDAKRPKADYGDLILS